MFETLLFLAAVTFGTVIAAGVWVVLGVAIEITTEQFRRLRSNDSR